MNPITSQGHDGVYCLRQKNGDQALQGLWVTSSRGSGILQGGKAPQHEGSTGRIYVKVGATTQEVFPSVYGLSWEIQEAFSAVNPTSTKSQQLKTTLC